MSVEFVTVAVLAVVSGGGKHDYACVDQSAHGATNRIVWITVRATGKKKIKGPELEPPLVFKARIVADHGETLAYGPLSRASKTAEGLAKRLAATASTPIATDESALSP